jgi:NADPH-dependent ferric siderophore reductase
LVNADPDAGTVDIDFAIHQGLATRWAAQAEAGDTLDVTVLGSNFALPEPAPSGYVIAGDAASLPAINSLLDAIGDTPAKVFLEAAHDDDRELPVGKADVTWVDRKEAAEALADAVGAAAFDAADHFGWAACDNRTTRAVAKIFREDYRIPRKSIKAQAYWAS